MKEKRSEVLGRVFPEYFSEDISIINKCLSVFEEIEHRYNRECNTTITRGQIQKIERLIIEINYQNKNQ